MNVLMVFYEAHLWGQMLQHVKYGVSDGVREGRFVGGRAREQMVAFGV